MRRNCNPLLLTVGLAAGIVLFIALLARHGRLHVAECRKFPFLSLRRHELRCSMSHAETSWLHSVGQRKDMMKEAKGQFPTDVWDPINLFDFVRPAYTCPFDLERIGSIADGGKWVCGMTQYEENKRPCIIYSFGVDWNSQFEADMMNRTNCEIWGYDYSVDKWGEPVVESERAHFTQAGISRTTNRQRDPPFYSVKDLMDRNGHDYVDIMKMDIEGWEFDALNGLLSASGSQDVALPVGQLLVEVHMMPPPNENSFHIPESLHSWVGFWENLEAAGMREVFIEHNFIGDVKAGRPLFAELSLINVEDNRILFPGHT